MAVVLGSRLGPFEIQSALGAGGMGEVYRARDTRLSRDVAIKLLPEAVAVDADRIARFSREAQTLAALNHPHIAQIYGVELDGTTRALVMELVEGETLAGRIAHGPIPIDETIAIARQIAGALEAAHESGIIHRDLKPANIKVRADGTVKVLDFGLAKVLETRVAGAPDADTPTATSPIVTRAGAVLGTVAYMSPEQAKGLAVDRRTDIWAFGCVMFEMLTGRRAFAGDDASETLASVLRNDPDWRRLPPDTPAAVRTILERALARNPADRLSHIAVARFLLSHGAGAVSEPPARVSAGRVGMLGLAVVVLLGLATVLYVNAGRSDSSPVTAPIAQYSLVLPAGVSITGHQPISISRDGRLVVFAGSGTRPSLFLRERSAVDASPITGTEGGNEPALDPSGQWLVFHVRGSLKKIALVGGVAVTLCEALHPHGIVWSRNGRIYFTVDQGRRGIWSVDAAGGEPSPVTTVDSGAGELAHEYPEILPGGDGVIFNVLSRSAVHGDAKVVVTDFSTGTTRTLVEGGFAPKLTSSGTLLFTRGSVVYGARFDPARREIVGPAVPVVKPVHANSANGTTRYDVARDADVLVFQRGDDEAARVLRWVSPDGTISDAATTPRTFDDLDLSPDMNRIAATVNNATIGPTQLWVGEPNRGTLYALLTSEERFTSPRWAPDSAKIAFGIAGTGEVRVADLSGNVQAFSTGGSRAIVGSWSPDGRTLAVQLLRADQTNDIGTFDLTTQKLTPLATTPASEANPQFSPDGRWLAYQSNRSGRSEIEVRPFGRSGAPIQVSSSGGARPVWSADGASIYFQDARGMIVRAAFKEGRVSTQQQVARLQSFYRFDVARDGRVLLIEAAESASEPLILFEGFARAASNSGGR